MLAEREALENVKDHKFNNLKQSIPELTYENNKYHLTIWNCTFCGSDDYPDNSDASSWSDASITASTAVSLGLPSSVSSTIPALMSGLEVKEKQADTGGQVPDSWAQEEWEVIQKEAKD